MNAQSPNPTPGQVPQPARKFKIKYVAPQDQEHVVAVDPAGIPYSDHGLPGSLLDIALAHGVDIDHACGGVCACGTCHVIVRAGFEACNPPSDAEEDRLDEAYGVTPNSRLACQCVPDGTEDLVVEIPAWNRNLAREGR